jgi:type IV secretory pathway VirB2 component (pilin)
MKKHIALLFVFIANIQSTFAENWVEQDLWLFWSTNSCLPENAMREWNIHIEDIPCMIQGAINFFLWIAWTIAVIFVIIWAYKILFGSLSQDKTKWKDTIIMALTGFAIATLSWFIIKILLDNFK